MNAAREFLAMGGYGVFVWTSYGLTAVVLVANVFAAAARERRLLRELGRVGAEPRS